MPKLSSKSQLFEESQAAFARLENQIAQLTSEQMMLPGALGEWSVKDVLAHLYAWQQMMFGWHEAGLRGDLVETPGRGYKWNQLPALNQEIYETYRDMPIDEVLEKFRDSHQRVLELVKAVNEEDLFSPGRFVWTGKHSLATFINANTASHYRWAETGLRKQMSPRKKRK